MIYFITAFAVLLNIYLGNKWYLNSEARKKLDEQLKFATESYLIEAKEVQKLSSQLHELKDVNKILNKEIDRLIAETTVSKTTEKPVVVKTTRSKKTNK